MRRRPARATWRPNWWLIVSGSCGTTRRTLRAWWGRRYVARGAIGPKGALIVGGLPEWGGAIKHGSIRRLGGSGQLTGGGTHKPASLVHGGGDVSEVDA